jgi:hypothetical protein
VRSSFSDAGVKETALPRFCAFAIKLEAETPPAIHAIK